MIYLFLILSLTLNGVLVWYVRKLVQKLSYGVDNVDQLQQLLDEYCSSLESMLELEMYYGDETMLATVKNTRMVIDLCRGYKKTIMPKEENTSDKDNEQSIEG